jgi:pimeloyl-ACP methyl ester carboxylesterase
MDVFRASAEQAEDVAAVVLWAKQQWHVPVTLVGTSRGSVSAANAAARGVVVDGLVLTSSVTVGSAQHPTLRELPLDQIGVPTLFVHHETDQCNLSPMSGARDVANFIPGGVTWRQIAGGDTPTGGACTPQSYHGFIGREDEALTEVAQFVAALP